MLTPSLFQHLLTPFKLTKRRLFPPRAKVSLITAWFHLQANSQVHPTSVGRQLWNRRVMCASIKETSMRTPKDPRAHSLTSSESLRGMFQPQDELMYEWIRGLNSALADAAHISTKTCNGNHYKWRNEHTVKASLTAQRLCWCSSESSNYVHLGSSSDSSEPPPTSPLQSGPLSNIIPLFIKVFAECIYFEVFCESKMSKTNQNLCTILTDSEPFFLPENSSRMKRCCFQCQPCTSDRIYWLVCRTLVSQVCCVSVCFAAQPWLYLHFIAHFCISDSSGRGEFSSYFIKPICSYRSWLRNLAGRLEMGTF